MAEVFSKVMLIRNIWVALEQGLERQRKLDMESLMPVCVRVCICVCVPMKS